MGITELCEYLPLCLCFAVLCFVTWNNFLMTSIEIWLKQIEQELKGRLPEKLPQDEIHLNPSTPERSGLMQGSNPRSRDQPTGNDYGDSLSSLIVHPDSQSISDMGQTLASMGLSNSESSKMVISWKLPGTCIISPLMSLILASMGFSNPESSIMVVFCKHPWKLPGIYLQSLQ